MMNNEKASDALFNTYNYCSLGLGSSCATKNNERQQSQQLYSEHPITDNNSVGSITYPVSSSLRIALLLQTGPFTNNKRAPRLQVESSLERFTKWDVSFKRQSILFEKTTWVSPCDSRPSYHPCCDEAGNCFSQRPLPYLRQDKCTT
ncbi:hypothetical protein HD806DRAFT_344524 [Xylariaceae sp. AK1471]|nr:hypothetical protein HD806DRAFT_344524 [Xylariaceae sp. AK1471]